MNVSATATGSTVTLFLYATQQWPSEINNVFWDDATLSVGGSGGAAADAPGAPTPAPTVVSDVPFVNAQGERPDGSIVHIVQSGDTLDSIAYAYGVTRADLLALNNIADPRIIQIGQEIIVKPPTATQEVTPEATVLATTEAVSGAGKSADQSTPTVEPPPMVRDAAPAPVISVASGSVVYPIDPSDQTASICAALFEDGNQNRIQDSGENALSGGNLLLTSGGAPAAQHDTDGSPDPYCFEGLTPGDYVVVASAPSGYGLTTPDQLKVQAYPGAQINVEFGAAQGVQAVEPPPPDSSVVDAASSQTAASSPLTNYLGLIVFGAAGVVLIVGMSLSIILRRR